MWMLLTLRRHLSMLTLDYDDAALDEEYGGGLVGAGVTEEVEDM